jgi:hypothetical protein
MSGNPLHPKVGRNIFAHTEPCANWPGFISVNQNGDGSLSVTVREPGHGGMRIAKFDLPAEQLGAMAVCVNAAIATAPLETGLD